MQLLGLPADEFGGSWVLWLLDFTAAAVEIRSYPFQRLLDFCLLGLRYPMLVDNQIGRHYARSHGDGRVFVWDISVLKEVRRG